jgi:hypothetical protein
MLIPLLASAGVKAPMADLRTALTYLAAGSHGSISLLPNDRMSLNTAVEEIERRLSITTASDAPPRRASTFRQSPRQPDS